jgi:serine/threonine protein kinase
MPRDYTCAEISSWVLRPSFTLDPEQTRLLEEHLELCTDCQALLDWTSDRLEDPFLDLAREVGDPTLAPVDTALDQVLTHLHEARSPVRSSQSDPPDLYFLSKTSRPGLLGMLGDYEVQELIGQGGMGIVLKAFEPSLHRLVAIKVMAASVAGSATARRRFTREAQAAASICHDHVITVHGVSEIDGLPFMVMQYVGGESLQARLDREGPLELEEIVRIGLQTAQGLAAAHAQGLIHRDIKPANLLLENGLTRVKITDFGLARMTDDVSLTQNGVVTGTPEYMAPEQARGDPVDHRSDLFSLGSVLYAMCAGTAPFRSGNTVAVLRKVSEEAPPSLRSLTSSLPVWLEQFIARLMTKNPDNRIQTSAEAAALLEGYLAHLRQPATVRAPRLPASPRKMKLPRRRVDWALARDLARQLWPAALLALLGLGLGRGIIEWGLANVEEPSRVPERGERTRQVLDFRKPITAFAPVAVLGRDAASYFKTDSQGLRITLPRTRLSGEEVGIQLNQRLRGDFSAELGYEILSIGTPVQERGAGVIMRLTLDSAAPQEIFISRLRKPLSSASVPRSDQPVYLETFGAFYLARDRRGQEIPRGAYARAQHASGRFRLVRTAGMLDFFAQDGDIPFRKVHSEHIGTNDMVDLRVLAFTAQGVTPLDVRFTDLVVDTEAAPFSADSSVPLQYWTPQSAAHPWLIVTVGTLIILVAFVTAGLLGYIRWRKLVSSSGLNGAALARQKPASAGATSSAKLTRSTKVVLGTGVLLILAPACWAFLPGNGASSGQMKRFYQDLRSVDLTGPYLKPINKEVEPGPGGVRVLIAGGNDKTPPAGLSLSTILHGDFEITSQFEILKADIPISGFGVGVSLYAQAVGNAKNAVLLARRLLPGAEAMFITERAMGGLDGAEQHRLKSFPARANAGRLRLKRTGPIIHYQIAEGDAKEFAELDQADMGRDDIQCIQISGHTGGSNAELDLRLLELTILAKEMPGLPGTPTIQVEAVTAAGMSVFAGLALLFSAGWHLRPALLGPEANAEFSTTQLGENRWTRRGLPSAQRASQRNRNTRGRVAALVGTLAGGIASSVAMSVWASPADLSHASQSGAACQLPIREKRWSLQSASLDRTLFELTGPAAGECVRFEATGLRISIPATKLGLRPDIGLRLKQPARGDFDLVVHFELLHEPAPGDPTGDQTQVNLEAILDTQHQDVATVSRQISLKDGKRWVSSVSIGDPLRALRQSTSNAAPAAAMTGRLRLVRTGPVINFFAADDSQGDWIPLGQRHLGPDDLKAIGLTVSTGAPGAIFDVRLTDLTLKAMSLASDSPALSISEGAQGGWIGAAVVLAVITVLSGSAIWLGVRAGWCSTANMGEPNSSRTQYCADRGLTV